MKKYKTRLKIYHKLDNLMIKYSNNIILFELFNYMSVYFYKIFIDWNLKNIENK